MREPDRLNTPKEASNKMIVLNKWHLINPNCHGNRANEASSFPVKRAPFTVAPRWVINSPAFLSVSSQATHSARSSGRSAVEGSMFSHFSWNTATPVF